MASIDLDERIRALIKLMVDETDPVMINAVGTALERLLALERTTVPTRVEAFGKR